MPLLSSPQEEKIQFQPIREHLMLMRLIYDLKKYKYSKAIKSSFNSRSLHTAVDHPLITSPPFVRYLYPHWDKD